MLVRIESNAKQGNKREYDPLEKQITPIFSPRDSLQALDWYAAQANGANDALFMTFAFGMNKRFQDAYRTGTAKLRYALMEAMSGPTRTKEQRLANEAAIVKLRKMKANKFAIGSRLGKGAFNHWLIEQLSGLNVNVRYLHTKYMLVDPLGANSLVVCGSANFSEASTTNNDENMLIIRGNPRVADITLGSLCVSIATSLFATGLPNTRKPTKCKWATWTRPINGGNATLATASNPGNAATLLVRSQLLL